MRQYGGIFRSVTVLHWKASRGPDELGQLYPRLKLDWVTIAGQSAATEMNDRAKEDVDGGVRGHRRERLTTTDRDRAGRLGRPSSN